VNKALLPRPAQVLFTDVYVEISSGWKNKFSPDFIVGSGSWGNKDVFGRVDALTSQDFKNPAYFNLKVDILQLFFISFTQTQYKLVHFYFEGIGCDDVACTKRCETERDERPGFLQIQNNQRLSRKIRIQSADTVFKACSNQNGGFVICI